MSFVRWLVLLLVLPTALLASVSDPVRVIFLVHGWNGSTDSFGIVPKRLAAEQPGFWPAGYREVVSIAFKAPRPDATLNEQATACGAKMQSALSEIATRFPGRLREIYFVTHSMGGLIVRQLYLDNREKADGLGAAFRDLKVAVDDRTWICRMRKEAGQAKDATWTRKLLVRVAGRVRPVDLPADVPATEDEAPAEEERDQ